VIAVTDITVAELVEAARQLQSRVQPEPDGKFLTTEQHAARWGITRRRALELIRDADALGWVEKRQVPYMRLDGRAGWRTAYKIERPAAEAEKPKRKRR
jgi:hypothetical protein